MLCNRVLQFLIIVFSKPKFWLCEDIKMSKLSVLIVTDDLYTLNVLKFFFESVAKVAVDFALTQTEAIGIYRNKLHNIVVVDRNLSGSNGFSFVQKLKRTPGHELTYVMLLTDGVDKDLLVAHKANRVDYLLLKPINPAKLTSRIEKIKANAQRMMKYVA